MCSAPGKDDLSLEHLQAELKRIDILIRREVQRWQLAGQDPSDEFRGLYLSDAQSEVLLARPFGTSWGQTVSLTPDETRAFDAVQAQAAQQSRALAQTARQQGHLVRLEHLAATFGLDQFEMDVFLVSLAPSLDTRYGQLYGYLQDDVSRKQASVNLALNLLSAPGSERLKMMPRFGDDAPLFKYRLVERIPAPRTEKSPLLSQALEPDPAIVAWLLGEYQPHAELKPHAQLIRPQTNVQDLVLASDVWPGLEHAIDKEPVLVFYGPDGATQHATARLVAAHTKRPLLQVSLGSVAAAGKPPHQALKLALRDARFIGAIPYLTGWDVCLVESTPPPSLLAELFTYSGLTIIAGQKSWQAQGIARERTLLWMDFDVPDYRNGCAIQRHMFH